MMRCMHHRHALAHIQGATHRSIVHASLPFRPRPSSECHREAQHGRWPSQRPGLCRAASGVPTSSTHVDHNHLQVQAFSQPQVVNTFTEPLPQDVQQRLTTIVAAIPGLSSSSRVIDVGSGTGCLIPRYQERGVQDILAVDLSAAMLEELKATHASNVTHLGNQLGVRTWNGDVVDLPNYLGWASDAFVFNAVFGNLHSPRAALIKAALQLKPGGHIVISHPLGRAWHAWLAEKQPTVTPHVLPDRPALDALIQGLPLQVVEFRDEPDLYLAVLQVPPRYVFPGAPVRMNSVVVKGFGRGSRQLGTPTANLDLTPLQDTLAGLQQGVYYGWARLLPKEGSGSWSPQDLQVHKMVMNVGKRPTVNTGAEAPTVEVHVMHNYTQDFYGQEMRAVALGYIRPELKFAGGLPELMGRIKLDVAIGRNQLDDPECSPFKDLLM